MSAEYICKKNHFYLPDDLIYLDGNSLGPMPLKALEYMPSVMQNQWGEKLIGGWNDAGWYDQPIRVGDRIARLVGADTGCIVTGETLSIKVYQALAAALDINSDRRVILSDNGNFPTDLYIAEGLIKTLDKGHQLACPNPEEVEDSIDDSVAVLMLTEVDYKTSRRHDMKRLTEKAREHGVITIWDLAHSAGAIPIDLQGCDIDFAIGCTYKYLNGGPGSPAFIYVAKRHSNIATPALSGWMGHQAPFSFEQSYRAHEGTSRMRVGTPPVLALSVLEAALDVFDGVDMHTLYQRSRVLSELFIKEVMGSCPSLILASPEKSELRGSHVSFYFEHAFSAIQALIDLGVVGDFRAPNVMRFGITPLYLEEADISLAAQKIASVVNQGLWKKQIYQKKGAVT